MIAFLKRNGGWLLLAVIMLTLLVCLPLIEKDPKIGIAFEIIVENHTNDTVDGISMDWTFGEKTGTLDYVSYEELVRFPVKIGGSLVIPFTDEMLEGQPLPARLQSGFAVLATLNDKEQKVMVNGTADLEVCDGGEYVFFLEGVRGSYVIRFVEKREPEKK